jgi:hypothetical protein
MKKTLTLFATIIAFNVSALSFSIFPPAGFPSPDFDGLERATQAFIQEVETLRESDEVQSLVSKIEGDTNTACTVVEKERGGLVWIKLPYKCEGSKDFKLVIKARTKKGQVLIKNYKMK